MTSPPRIRITTDGNPKHVTLQRTDGVPDSFWLRARGEFGPLGRVNRGSITLPAERFLLHRYILRAVCQQHSVGIDLDPATLELLQAAEHDRAQLAEILRDPPLLDEGDVLARLDGSRFRRTLTGFQRRDLRRLLALPHGANFSVPGAGKTTATYAIYEAERQQGRVDQMLVVGPLSSFEAWELEAEECFNPVPLVARHDNDRLGSEIEVLLVGYQRLMYHYDAISRWVARGRTHVVLDEAHRMKKGRHGAWGAACLDLAYVATRRDILTGTPAPQSPGDLETLLDFLWPTQGSRLVPDIAHRINPPAQLTHEIARDIKPLFVRTSKRDMALPPVIHHPEKVKLTGLHRDIYDAIKNRYAGEFKVDRRGKINLVSMGQVVMYLLEAATNPALLVTGSSRYDPIPFRHPPLEIPKGSDLYELLQDYASYEVPAKLVRLAQMVTANAEQGNKTLVWTNFVRNLVTLRRDLAALEPAMIHGGIPPTGPDGDTTRETELDRFRNDRNSWVLLANPASIGEGLSLHRSCHHAIYLDRTFNAGQYLQSVDRIHRLGLPADQDTHITSLMTENTIDEIVDKRVRVKAETLGRLLDDPDITTMALPDEEDYGPAIDTQQDLVALLSHLRGEPDGL